jgi:GNAT superfamily N-acetyltransferase
MPHAPEVQIRLVRPHEHAQLRCARLSALAYAPHLAEHLAAETTAPSEFWRDRAERAASATTMATFVATEQHAFVGIVDGFLTKGRATVEIGGMWVSPHRRRAGIGRELLSAIVAWARQQGVTRAALWVTAANQPARTLYERDGFELAETSGERLRLEKTI